jgi:hypothetical protein
MYFHPLQEEFSKLSDEDISKKIQELSKKKASATRFGRNPELIGQLNNALESYRGELRTRRIKSFHDNMKKARNEPDMGELVNIE